MNLNNVNYLVNTSKVSGNQQVKDTQNVNSSEVKEQKEIKLPGFEQMSSVIGRLEVESLRTGVVNVYSETNVIKEFVKQSFSLPRIKNVHKEWQDNPEVLARLHTTPGWNGKLLMHKASVDGMKEIHRALKDQPDVLAKIHTTRCDSGDLPIHSKAYNSEIIKEIDEIFKDQPEVLAKIYTTRDSFGFLPIHNADLEGMKEIHRALKDQPEVLAKIHTTEGFGRELPIHKADLDGVKEIHRALKDQPQVLAKIHLTKNLKNNYPIKYETAKIFMQAIGQAIANKFKQD